MGTKPTEPTEQRSRAEENLAINSIAAGQAGQISYHQLREIGLSSRSIARRVDSGLLHPRSERRPRPSGRRTSLPERSSAAASSPRSSPIGSSSNARPPKLYLPTGVYGTQAGRLTLDGLRWSAVLSGPPGSLLSAISALVAAGLAPQRGHTMHVLRLGERWDAPKGVVPHRTSWLPEADRTQFDGIPSTSVARSLMDAACSLEARVLDDILDTAVRKGEYDGRGVVRVLEDRPTFKGARPLTAAVARLDATSGTFRSIFERRTKRLMETSTLLPPAAVNVLVHGFESDLHVPGTRAIIECDGRDYHRSPAQIARDEERERILRALGFVFLRLRWHHVVYEEASTLKRIERFVLANLEPPTPIGI